MATVVVVMQAESESMNVEQVTQQQQRQKRVLKLSKCLLARHQMPSRSPANTQTEHRELFWSHADSEGDTWPDAGTQAASGAENITQR